MSENLACKMPLIRHIDVVSSQNNYIDRHVQQHLDMTYYT